MVAIPVVQPEAKIGIPKPYSEVHELPGENRIFYNAQFGIEFQESVGDRVIDIDVGIPFNHGSFR